MIVILLSMPEFNGKAESDKHVDESRIANEKSSHPEEDDILAKAAARKFPLLLGASRIPHFKRAAAAFRKKVRQTVYAKRRNSKSQQRKDNNDLSCFCPREVDEATAIAIARMEHLQTVDEEVAIAIAIMESHEARPRCFHCGTRTDNPLRPSIYARQKDNPHIACSLGCLQKVCDWWIVM